MAFDKVKNKVVEGRGKLKAAARDKGHAVVSRGLVELREARPLLIESGFDVIDIVVTVTVPPSFTVVLEPREGAELRPAEVLEREGLTKPQEALLRALAEVVEANALIEADGFSIARVGIEMGTPPRLRLNLRPKAATDGS